MFSPLWPLASTTTGPTGQPLAEVHTVGKDPEQALYSLTLSILSRPRSPRTGYENKENTLTSSHSYLPQIPLSQLPSCSVLH
jgi:hypothetical protein